MTSGRFTPAAATRTSTSFCPGSGVGRVASLSSSGPPGAAISTTVISFGAFDMIFPFALRRAAKASYLTRTTRCAQRVLNRPDDVRLFARTQTALPHAPIHAPRLFAVLRLLL